MQQHVVTARQRAEQHDRRVQVAAALRRALDDFFGSKKSRLPRKLLEGCLRAHPRAAPQLLPDVLARAAAARTPFLRAEALALLAQLLRPPKVKLNSFEIR
jgi:hypothetical protein